MLLRRMADYQPELVRRATAELGRPRSAVPEAHHRWQTMIRSRTFPVGLDRLRIVLGPPEALFTREFGDAVHEVAHWRLPLWPDLRYEAMARPGGPALQEWLVRPDPATAPDLATAADVRPWTCVVGDLEKAFGPVEHEDGDAPSRWTVAFTSPGPTSHGPTSHGPTSHGPTSHGPTSPGPTGRHLARFAWGLVQTVSPLAG